MRGIERADRWPLAQARFSAHEALSCRIGAQAKARSSHVGRPFTRSAGGHLAQHRTPDRPDRTEYSGRDPLLQVTTTVRDTRAEQPLCASSAMRGGAGWLRRTGFLLFR